MERLILYCSRKGDLIPFITIKKTQSSMASLLMSVWEKNLYEIEFEMKAPASEGKYPLYRTWGNITQSAFPWFGALSFEVSIWSPEQCFCRSFQKLEDSLDVQRSLVPDRRILSSFLYPQGCTLEHCGVNHTLQANIFSHNLWYSSYCGIFCYVKNSLRGI